MALEIYDKFITQTDSGETVPNATVAIYGNGGGLSPLFNDKNGSSTASNPFTADINGRVKVYLESGRYTVIASNGNEVITYNDVLIAFSESDLDLSSYGALASDQTWTGINTFEVPEGSDFKILSENSTTDFSVVIGNAGREYEYFLKYHGSGTSNNNDISLSSSSKTLFRSSQNGIVNFPNGLQFEGYSVYNTNNLSLSTLGYTGDLDANNYTHPAYVATNINTSGATIVDSIETNSTGHITDMTTRTLNLGDLGYTGADDANNYIHPSSVVADITTTGLEIISSITTNSTGHITGMSKRTLPSTDVDLSNYGELDGDQSWTGVNTFEIPTGSDFNILSSNPTSDFSVVIGNTGREYEYFLKYHGSGASNNNDISLSSSSKTLFRSSQDGIVNFPNGLQSGGYNVYSTNNLSLSTLGYTGASDANNYVHPIYATTNINTSGATIVDSIETNSTGHITDMTTRTLTAGDLGALTSSNLSNYARTDTNVTFDAGTNTTVNIKSDDTGESRLNLMGDSQGTGIVYVGQSIDVGAGIVYNGDGSPSFANLDSDHLGFFRFADSSYEWTAKNQVQSNDWIFRSDVYVNETDKVYNTGNLTYGTGAAPTNMAIGDIYIELES